MKKDIVKVSEPMDSSKIEKAIKSAEAFIAKVDVSNEIEVGKAKEMIKNLKQQATEAQDEYVIPAKQIIENAKLRFGPLIVAATTAERLLKDRVIAHVQELKRIEDEKKEKLAKRVENGTMKAETAVRKIDEIGDTKASVGGVKVRMIKDYKIVDESKIPDEYWTKSLNSGLIRRVAITEGKQIPGIEVFEKPSGSF